MEGSARLHRYRPSDRPRSARPTVLAPLIGAGSLSVSLAVSIDQSCALRADFFPAIL